MEPTDPPTGPQRGFTLALTGDVIHTRRLAPLVDRDPGFAAVVERLRAADATFINFEFAAAERDDPDAWVWSVPVDWALGSEPRVVTDLRELGVDLAGRANNHAMDRGPAGLRTTSRLLDEAGIVHAGAGEDASRARAPRFLDTARGRIGLISATTSPSPPDVAPALDAFAGLAPRPGLHVLRVDATVTVPDDVRAALQQLHDRMPDAMGEWMNQQGGLILFGARFEPGDDVTVSYAVDAEDKAALLRSIRQSHVQADVTIFAIHAHQGDHDPAHPMEHLRQLAREAIGAGADVVVVSGPHAPAPVELHDGRPIFYGLGDFVWSDVGGPLPAYIWRQTRAVLGEGIDPASMSEADLITRLNADGFSDAWVFRGVLAEVTFGDDGIAGIDLHPVDLGLERSLTRRGIPRVPSSEVGHEIVERMAEMSAPLGTKIARSADIASIVFPEP